MTLPFALTPDDPPRPSCYPYEWSHDASCWYKCRRPELRRVAERFATYPDQVLAEVEAGATVRVDRSGWSLYIRRTPTAAEVDTQLRQMTLFGSPKPQSHPGGTAPAVHRLPTRCD